MRVMMRVMTLIRERKSTHRLGTRLAVLYSSSRSRGLTAHALHFGDESQFVEKVSDDLMCLSYLLYGS